MNKYLKSPWGILGLIVLGDILMMGNILPRAFTYVLAAIALLYVLAAPLNGVLTFSIAHVPFSPALPIPGFDSFALWRLVVIALAFRLLWSERFKLQERFSIKKLLSALTPEDLVGIFFLAWATLSLVVATDLVVGIRKLVFLGNAILLYMILRWVLPRIKGATTALLHGLWAGLMGLLTVGVAQYIVIGWASLFEFWQSWSLDVIPVFYGQTLGETLNISNTWFAYYPPPFPPTLRMFSLLPDSHSFGIAMLLAFLLGLAALAGNHHKKYRVVLWGLVATFGIAIFTNGSRGIWLAAVPTALLSYVALVFSLRQGRPAVARAGKIFFLGFLLLTLLFPVSSFISAQAHGAGIDGKIQLDVAFRRAQSILDLDELSNRGRIGIWITNLKSVARHPILGVGIGNVAIALEENISAARRGASAHNLYLDFAVETGLLGGLLVLAWFLTIFFRHILWLARGKGSAIQTAYVLALVLATAWIGIYNLVDIVFINDRALLLFLTFLALVVATTRQTHHEAAA